jgi:hypothetical protein
MPNLDPHPLNELGRGILDPTVEAKLLASGVVFARTVRTKTGKSFIDCYFRPFLQTIHEQEVRRLGSSSPPPPRCRAF